MTLGRQLKSQDCLQEQLDYEELRAAGRVAIVRLFFDGVRRCQANSGSLHSHSR